MCSKPQTLFPDTVYCRGRQEKKRFFHVLRAHQWYKSNVLRNARQLCENESTHLRRWTSCTVQRVACRREDDRCWGSDQRRWRPTSTATPRTARLQPLRTPSRGPARQWWRAGRTQQVRGGIAPRRHGGQRHGSREAMMAGCVEQVTVVAATAVVFDVEQRPGATVSAGGPPSSTVAAKAGNTKTPIRESATARLTISALLTVERSWGDRKTIASNSRFPVTVTTTSVKMAVNWMYMVKSSGSDCRSVFNVVSLSNSLAFHVLLVHILLSDQLRLHNREWTYQHVHHQEWCNCNWRHLLPLKNSKME